MMWRALAWFLSRAWVLPWLMAFTRPYRHIRGPDGSVYMYRDWLFNPYDRPGHWKWAPSMRVHRIMRPDHDRHNHDHPWDVARSIIMKGWYSEIRSGESGISVYSAGSTNLLKHGSFHRIHAVSSGGVYTLFITWKKVDTWGFDVDGTKVPWEVYLGEDVSSAGVRVYVQPDGTMQPQDTPAWDLQPGGEWRWVTRLDRSTGKVIETRPTL